MVFVDPTKLQHPSSGVLYEGYEGDYIVCRYDEEGIAGKDELYIFRCSADKQCCGRECCIPAVAGLPLWLWILLLILFLLLILCLLCAIAYFCWKLCQKKKTRTTVTRTTPVPVKPVHHALPPPPEVTFVSDAMDETYLPPPKPIAVQTHSESELGREQRPLITSRASDNEEQAAKFLYYRPFTPDPMEELVLPAPERTEISFHHASEISESQQPEMSRVNPGDPKQAEVVYLRPTWDKVAAY